MGATSATLHGSIDDSCLFYFDYATDAYFIANSGNYDQQTPESTGPPFSQTVAALLPNTTYHYRFVADNCNDRCFVAGADATFTTGTTTPEPPPRPPIDPHADLGVEVTASQATVLASSRRLTAAGSALTYTILVRNWGPREATAVQLTDVLPAQVSFTSLSATQGSCTGGSTVSCAIGVLGFGSSATVTITTKVTAAGSAINTATVSNKDQPDGNPSNQTSAATTTIPALGVFAPPPPPPIYGQTFNARPVSGIVLVRLPGTTTFVPLTDLTNVPQGTEFDTTNGHVELTSASDPAGDLQSAEFYGSRFILTYAPPQLGTAPLPAGTPTTLVTQLLLSTPLTCPSTKKRTTAAPPITKRDLWGTGKGTFRTRGRYAAATVRGTYWFTEDTCATTLVKVREGIVDVYDFVVNRHFLVGPGQSHLARKKP